MMKIILIQKIDMKKIITQLFLCSVISLALYSCGNKSHAADPNGKEYTSDYICPMHCKGSGSDAKGTCPVCKMDYVENKEKNKIE